MKFQSRNYTMKDKVDTILEITIYYGRIKYVSIWYKIKMTSFA